MNDYNINNFITLFVEWKKKDKWSLHEIFAIVVSKRSLLWIFPESFYIMTLIKLISSELSICLEIEYILMPIRKSSVLFVFLEDKFCVVVCLGHERNGLFVLICWGFSLVGDNYNLNFNFKLRNLQKINVSLRHLFRCIAFLWIRCKTD